MKKRIGFITVLLLVGLLALGVSGVAAQGKGLDPSADPNFGSTSLQAGFTPDPFIVTMISGGDLDVSTTQTGADCSGFATVNPDYRLEWSGDSQGLRLFFASTGESTDTTLIVRDPNGDFSCNDDTDGFNPSVDFPNPDAGTYTIWVGSYNTDEFVPGYLMITELNSMPSAVITDAFQTTTQNSTNGSIGNTQNNNNDNNGNNSNNNNSNDSAYTGVGSEIEGLQVYTGLSNLHVDGAVDYPQSPPAGGQHSAQLLACGVYRQPVPNENAVHSLEHGAVWITYDPDLPQDEIDTLEQLGSQTDHRIVSPYPGLRSPIVVTAWGFQLDLESADDPRLMQFINTFEEGPTTPERGAAC
jgi:hypothetical protein